MERKSLKQKLIDSAHSRYGKVVLYGVSFIESAFFPIPPDIMVVPMAFSKPETWKRLALWVTVFSVLGGFLGYFIGYGLYESVGLKIVETYHLQDEMAKVGELYREHAFLSLLVAAFTPIPYKVFTIAAGVFHIDLLTFALASIIGRGARYILVAYISSVGGGPLFRKYLRKLNTTTWVVVGIGICMVLYFFLR